MFVVPDPTQDNPGEFEADEFVRPEQESHDFTDATREGLCLDENCVICDERLDETTTESGPGVMLTCGHCFHEKCIETWFQRKHKNYLDEVAHPERRPENAPPPTLEYTCPTCRREVETDNFRTDIKFLPNIEELEQEHDERVEKLKQAHDERVKEYEEKFTKMGLTKNVTRFLRNNLLRLRETQLERFNTEKEKWDKEYTDTSELLLKKLKHKRRLLSTVGLERAIENQRLRDLPYRTIDFGAARASNVSTPSAHNLFQEIGINPLLTRQPPQEESAVESEDQRKGLVSLHGLMDESGEDEDSDSESDSGSEGYVTAFK